MAFRNWILAAALVVAATMPAHAQQDAVMRAAAQVAGEAMYYSSGAVGMVMAVVRGGDSFTLGFGSSDANCVDGRGPIPKRCKVDGTTMVRLGSVSKVFAGYVLSALSQASLPRPLNLNRPINEYLSEKIPPFPPGGTPGAWAREVILIDLATHTAGMPRDITDDLCAPPNPPYCTMESKDYDRWLKNFRLPYRPGTVASYSNAGFGVLGMAMKEATGQTFDALLGTYIREAKTVKMADTGTTLSPDQQRRMMTGYDGGKPVPDDWNGTEVMQPSGGILSTADDMAKWLNYNLRAGEGLGPAAALAQATYVARPRLNAVIALDSPGRPLDGIGLGWEINNASGSRPMIIQKTGAFSGFMAYVAFAPGRDVGVFFALNKIDVPVLFNLMDQANNLIAGLATR